VIDVKSTYPSWTPSLNGTGDTTRSPLISFDGTKILSLKVPYYSNFSTDPNRWQGFFVNPSTSVPGSSATGQMIMYIGHGGPYTTSISNTPCAIPQTRTGGLCLITMGGYGGGAAYDSIRYYRYDSTVTNSQFDATNGQACRLPQPDSSGSLYVNFKANQTTNSEGVIPTGCTSMNCIQLLPRSE
jgi:hypothetical protein